MSTTISASASNLFCRERRKAGRHRARLSYWVDTLITSQKDFHENEFLANDTPPVQSNRLRDRVIYRKFRSGVHGQSRRGWRLGWRNARQLLYFLQRFARRAPRLRESAVRLPDEPSN